MLATRKLSLDKALGFFEKPIGGDSPRWSSMNQDGRGYRALKTTMFRDYGILVLGPHQAQSVGGGAGGAFDSYRAAGTPMIAPPTQVPIGAFMGGMGMGGAGMAGMSARPSQPAPTEK
jgi:hypothetical protein